MTYKMLDPYRRRALKDLLNKARPSNRKDITSFAYLNILRVLNPKSAISKITNAIELDPENIAMHNLLGLAHIEAGQLSEAKVIYLSLLARGHEHAIFYNNLGVIASRRGQEDQARSYFNQALSKGKSPEAYRNLGFIALKYHNGFEAKKYFTKALKLDRTNPTSQIGRAVAQLQNREMETAVKLIPGLSGKYKDNPYARLSAAYLWMDIEENHSKAARMVRSFMRRFSGQRDLAFKKALNEATQRSVGDDLPTIE